MSVVLSGEGGEGVTRKGKQLRGTQKSKCLVNKCQLGRTETMGHGGNLNRLCSRAPLPTALGYIMMGCLPRGSPPGARPPSKCFLCGGVGKGRVSASLGP